MVLVGDRGAEERKYAVAHGLGHVAFKAMDGVRKFDRTGRRDRFRVAMERGTKKVVAFEYEVDPTEEPEYFIVGVLLLVSPWVLGFWTDPTALLVHSVFGVLLVIHAAWVLSRESPSEPKRGL